MNDNTFCSSSPEETLHIGRQIGASLQPNTVICLTGDLGAGKTTLVKGLVNGVTGESELAVTSPTFTYMNIYEGSTTVYHFDLYRLHDVDEFLGMGFDEYFDANGICCLEWPERIETALPRPRIDVELSCKGPNERLIHLRYR